MHQALYRKWRPQTFDDVCGQEHITSVLRYEAQQGAFSHAYLFCGSRGTGKTTCAKILAKVVNCEHPVNGSPCCQCDACLSIDSGAATDVLEMDAASNNGVDNIRDIRDEVVYLPSALRYRVYIIDEVHMLSVSAFNALLKTLEEPPEHVIFILATTELQKLPATIISRCQRFDFRRISTDALVDRLSYIAAEEGIALDADAARMLAKLAQGGMRDAISLLELCAGVERSVSVERVEASVGLTGRGALLETVNAVADKNYDALFSRVAEVVRSSKDLLVFWQDLISLWRDMLILKTSARAANYLDLTDHEAEEMRRVADRFRKETLLYHCKLLEEALFAMQKANAVKRIVAEMTLVRLCDASLDSSPEAMLSRIASIEEQLVTGRPATVPVKEADRAPLEVPDIKQAAQSAPKTKAEALPKRSGDKRVLHPIRSWMEVVERVSRSAPMVASFVKASRAFTTEDSRVIVRFDNDFAMRMMEQDASRDRLRAAVSAVLRREVGDRELIFEVVGKAADRSVIDEIIEASEDV
ncbi:MAG: DNA polymerase III subunit gamma/tau [Ruminococcaceae bacterium]|nr:DNA polymerase III subunit gamma/tau [Oscillospiraceae bacterium]